MARGTKRDRTLATDEMIERTVRHRVGPVSCVEGYDCATRTFINGHCAYEHCGMNAFDIMRTIKKKSDKHLMTELGLVYNKKQREVLSEALSAADCGVYDPFKVPDDLIEYEFCMECLVTRIKKGDNMCYNCTLTKLFKPFHVFNVIMDIVMTHPRIHKEVQDIVLTDDPSDDKVLFPTAEEFILARIARFMRRSGILIGGNGDASFISLLDNIGSATLPTIDDGNMEIDDECLQALAELFS